MAELTDNLKIPILLGSTHFSRDAINDALKAIDNNGLNIAHATTKAHWELWQADTDYALGDVFKTSDTPSWGYWEVTTAGTSGKTEPTGTSAGSTFKDGTCELTLRQLGTLGAAGTTGSASSNALKSITRSGDYLVFTDTDGNTTDISINDTSHAQLSDRAAEASIAIADSNSVNITSYVSEVTVNNNVVTVTKGDGTTANMTVGTSEGTGLLNYIANVEGSDDTITTTDANGNKNDIIIDNVANAAHAITADVADNATYDSAGNSILSYVKDVTVLGTVGTVTKGDGTTSTFGISDITSITSASDDTIQIEKNDGTTSTITIDNVQNANAATSATNDSQGNDITSYVKRIVGNSDGTVTIYLGDGTVYSAYVGGGDGGITAGIVNVVQTADNELNVTDAVGNSTNIIIDNVANATNATQATTATDAKNDANGVELSTYIHDITNSAGVLNVTTGAGKATAINLSATSDKNGTDLTSYVKDFTSADGVGTITKGDGTISKVSLGSIKSITGVDDTLTITDFAGATSTITINNVANAVSAINDAKGTAITDYTKNVVVSDGELTVTTGAGTSQSYQVATKIPTNLVAAITGQDDTITITDYGGTTSTIKINKIQDVTHSATADNATVATNDVNGNPITGYVSDVSISGTTETVTKGDGTSTTYDIHASLADKATVAENDSNNKPITDYVTDVVVSGNVGTVTKGNGASSKFDVSTIKSVTLASPGDTVVIEFFDGTKTNLAINNVPSAISATQDANGVNIDTYINDVTYGNNELTVTKGDGSSVVFDLGEGSVSTEVEPWSSGANRYYANKSLVTYNDSLYMCLVTHRPSKSFDTDYNLGYWKQVDYDITAVSDSGYYQSTKSNITASTSSPYTLNLPLQGGSDLFCLPPIEVLRKADGLTNQTDTVYTMSANDGPDFSYDKASMVFDGDLHPITDYNVKTTKPAQITDGTNTGYISETDYIDFSKWKSVEGIDVG